MALSFFLCLPYVAAQTPAANIGITEATGQTDQPPKSITIKIIRDGKTFYGKPVASDGKQLAVLRWDGRLEVLSPKSDKKLQITRYSDGFDPYSPDELRERLAKYFGERYNISQTEHFVVIHPLGSAKFWADPFEIHYQKLKHFFESNGLPLREPEFPLVAIVMGTRAEFARRLDAEADFNRGITGYYSRKTNRITTFDPSERQKKVPALRKRPAKNWIYRNPTVIHETAHQIAFNCGIHNRFSAAPKWITEGLAMLCETPGIYNFKEDAPLTARVNQQRLKAFRKLQARGKINGSLIKLIQFDRQFELDAELAYSVSWALSFYLFENQKKNYFAYLKADGQRRDFRNYSNTDRAAAFIRFFGSDLAGLEKKVIRFIDSLPQ